jgi:hypothetical protein
MPAIRILERNRTDLRRSMYDIYIMNSPIISPPVIVPPVVLPAEPAGVDAPAALDSTGELAGAAATANINAPFSPASVVDLSARAQLLAAADPAPIATLAPPNDNIVANLKNIAQLAASLQAQLNQEASIAQETALFASEATAINTALQSALADMALSESVAATASAETTAAIASAEAVATAATAETVANTVAIADNDAGIALNAELSTIATNAHISPADPTVAAAIAAYRLGDGLIAAAPNKPDETPPEAETNILPVPKIKASTLDLHDSERDDAANGVAWNWARVNPVHKKLIRR